MLGLPLTCDGLRTANRLTAPAGTIEHVLPSWLNSAAGNLTAANRMVEFDPLLTITCKKVVIEKRGNCTTAFMVDDALLPTTLLDLVHRRVRGSN